MVIMIVISTDPHLHYPMYFFLFHLALIDICYATTIVPYMLVNFLVKQKSIDFSACILQMSLILLSAGSEIFMLSAMAYDRYVAIWMLRVIITSHSFGPKTPSCLAAESQRPSEKSSQRPPTDFLFGPGASDALL
ncbi:PREDICTED: olfactory receptor 5V1-like [Chlamydotis macqueenii]|uniref:olfactory receptor 5V1-like n=1 Tax=Chlamydotis macqueenii TaxID=187382 RepID=UPI000529E797|nr:PREDICTED: olfactory receptor 5V1-like [Chlamydotis macqueenii]